MDLKNNPYSYITKEDIKIAVEEVINRKEPLSSTGRQFKLTLIGTESQMKTALEAFDDAMRKEFLAQYPLTPEQAFKSVVPKSEALDKIPKSIKVSDDANVVTEVLLEVHRRARQYNYSEEYPFKAILSGTSNGLYKVRSLKTGYQYFLDRFEFDVIGEFVTVLDSKGTFVSATENIGEEFISKL